jgi:hypothetical protein
VRRAGSCSDLYKPTDLWPNTIGYQIRLLRTSSQDDSELYLLRDLDLGWGLTTLKQYPRRDVLVCITYHCPLTLTMDFVPTIQ